MLTFNRKQMSEIGRTRMQQRLTEFLRGRLSHARAVPRAQFDQALAATLGRARQLGLQGQGAVATYALACSRFGSARVDGDAALQTLLRDRRMPQREKALLLRIWITHAARAAASVR